MMRYKAVSVAHVLLSATLVCVTGVVEDHPYCSLRYRRLCQGKGRHVGCQFPNPGPGTSCQNYSPIQFQDNLKYFITHYINRRRQRIAAGTETLRGGSHLPKPEVMMMVVILAERLADQCIFVHDDCRATVRFPYAGQTVGEVRWRRSSASIELTAQRAIRRVFDAWWGERRRVQPHQLTAPFRLTAKGASWGHFSQLAVWSLRAVGCGAVRHGATYPRLLIVCDFSHTNMLGQKTISPGSLSPCPTHTARRPRSSYPLLCAPVRYVSRNELYHYESETEYDLSNVGDYGKKDIFRVAAMQPRNRTAYPVLIATTTAVRLKQKTRERPTEVAEENTELQVIPRRKSNKGTFLEKLDRELEVKKMMKTKDQQTSFGDEQRWPSRPLLWRPNRPISNEEEFVPSPQPKVSERTLSSTTTIDERYVGMRRLADTEVPEKTLVRLKWLQTQQRSKRPGASALLNLPVTVSSRRRPVASIMLDQEDIEQLFRDTGFSPAGRNSDLRCFYK